MSGSSKDVGVPNRATLHDRLRNLIRLEPNLLLHVLVRVIAVGLPLTLLPSIYADDIRHFWDVGNVVGLHTLPYRDFLWEFPPLTTLILVFVPLGGHIYATFAVLTVLTMVACEVGTFLIVRRLLPAPDRALASWYWLAVFVPFSTIAYFRLDWPAALFGALALVGLLARQPASSVLGIACGFFVKIWTIVFVVPLIGLKRFIEAGAAIVTCALLVGGWALYSRAGLEKFLEYRKGSAFQIESIPGSLVMLFSHHPVFVRYEATMVSDDGWTWIQPVLPLIFVIASAVCILVMWTRKVEVVSLTAGLVLLLLLTSRLLSPQYLVWLAPFLVLLIRRSPVMTIAFAAAAYLTLFEITFYDRVSAGVWLLSLAVVLRNLALCAVLVELFRTAFARQAAEK